MGCVRRESGRTEARKVAAAGLPPRPSRGGGMVYNLGHRARGVETLDRGAARRRDGGGPAVAQSLEALETRTRSSYYYDPAGDEDPSTGTLHLKLVSTGADWEELRVEPRRRFFGH